MVTIGKINIMMVPLLLLLTLPPVCCNTTWWSGDKFLNPRHDFQSCGNNRSSGFCDPDDIMDSGARPRLIKRLFAFEQSSIEASAEHRCCKVPVKITFAVFRKVQVKSGETSLAAVQRFVKTAAGLWFASDECDRWLMVALAVDDRRFFALRGRGVGLSDKQISETINAQKRHLAQKQYAKAIEAMVDEFQSKLDHLSDTIPWWGWLIYSIPGVVILVVCSLLCCRCCCDSGGGGGEGGGLWSPWHTSDHTSGSSLGSHAPDYGAATGVGGGWSGGDGGSGGGGGNNGTGGSW